MFGSNNFIDKPFYAVEVFDRKYENELIDFLNKEGLEIQQQSSAMIVWTGRAKNYERCEGNPIIYCPDLHKRKRDGYDLSLQFSSAGVKKNPKLERFLVDLAIKCNIPEYYNQNPRGTGKSLYYVVDKDHKRLIPQLKPKRLTRTDVIKLKSQDPAFEKLLEDRKKILASAGYSEDEIRADIAQKIEEQSTYLERLRMSNMNR